MIKSLSFSLLYFVLGQHQYTTITIINSVNMWTIVKFIHVLQSKMFAGKPALKTADVKILNGIVLGHCSAS